MRYALLPLLFAAPLALAETGAGLPDLTPPPVPTGTTEEMEPEVTIQQRGEQRIEEYSINGQVYMIKVVPAKGVPYYLIDTDGDGELESRRGELDPKLLVPSWTIFRW